MKTLIVFSHLRWNFVYQRPQHLLTRLSKFYKVLFVEEPVISNAGVFLDIQDVAPNIKTITPHTIQGGWGFNDAQLAIVAPMLKAWLREIDLSDGYGIWFYTPQALLMKDVLAPEFIVFDVMDELSAFAFAPPELKAREAELLKVADVVIAGGPSLYNIKKKVRPDTLLLPSSVDANHYSPARAAELEAQTHEEDRLEHDIPHPRLGFFGVIDERLDLELIAKLADADPHWHIVMVGPVLKIDPANLPLRFNIHWLGMQSYSLLPQIVQGWDVCLLPFALNKATQYISPTKTLEYMAAEKPIVSTAVHDVVELYGEVVLISETHEQFIGNVKAVLSEPQATRLARNEAGKKLVARSSWDSVAETIHGAIEVALVDKQKALDETLWAEIGASAGLTD